MRHAAVDEPIWAPLEVTFCDGCKAKATVDNPQSVAALNLLHHMRWVDNSMGANFDYGWSDINQAFAAGQVGMYVSGSDVYTNLVQASNIDPSIYGLAPIPLLMELGRQISTGTGGRRAKVQLAGRPLRKSDQVRDRLRRE